MLHTAREFLYGILFLGLAWFAWTGAWAVLLALLLAIEIVVTLMDFVEEDLIPTALNIDLCDPTL